LAEETKHFGMIDIISDRDKIDSSVKNLIGYVRNHFSELIIEK